MSATRKCSAGAARVPPSFDRAFSIVVGRVVELHDRLGVGAAGVIGRRAQAGGEGGRLEPFADPDALADEGVIGLGGRVLARRRARQAPRMVRGPDDQQVHVRKDRRRGGADLDRLGGHVPLRQAGRDRLRDLPVVAEHRLVDHHCSHGFTVASARAGSRSSGARFEANPGRPWGSLASLPP